MFFEKMSVPPPVILASASPRRASLLGRLGIPFRVETTDIPESEILIRMVRDDSAKNAYYHARKACSSIALEKACFVSSRFPDHLIISADTVVSTENQILGKPSDRENAIEMLRSLSGRDHCVYTAVALRFGSFEKTFRSKSVVTFYPSDDFQEELIRRYALSGDPLDKAGAYGIQETGGLLVSKIKGSYDTVVGLPLAKLARQLHSLGYPVLSIKEVSDAGIDS